MLLDAKVMTVGVKLRTLETLFFLLKIENIFRFMVTLCLCVVITSTFNLKIMYDNFSAELKLSWVSHILFASPMKQYSSGKA